MKLQYHVVISLCVSALVWVVFRSFTAAAACFATGVFLDIDHLIDYAINYGGRIRIRHLFKAFEYEAFENIFVFLHSWEFVVIYLALLWLVDWQPVAIGAGIGLLVHLLLDHFFNDHSRLAYFLSYRMLHGFSGKHFYGAAEYRKRLKRKRAAGGAETAAKDKTI
ncbi:MAG: hypothetical protein PHP98_02700 [Kiritimatiellae bacterium]|nr:hypothetical protein [Kiritimatiellia bacterium]